MNEIIFRVVVSCSFEKSVSFGGTCLSYLQGGRVSQAQFQQEKEAVQPGNGRNLFLRSARLSRNYKTLQLIREHSSKSAAEESRIQQ
jgi:hypothetical protein